MEELSELLAKISDPGSNIPEDKNLQYYLQRYLFRPILSNLEIGNILDSLYRSQIGLDVLKEVKSLI